MGLSMDICGQMREVCCCLWGFVGVPVALIGNTFGSGQVVCGCLLHGFLTACVWV